MNFVKFEDFDENTITKIENKKFKIVNKNANIDCTVEKKEKRKFFLKKNTYMLKCQKDETEIEEEINNETELINKLSLKPSDCSTLTLINNNDDYKEILSELKCSKSKIETIVDIIKTKFESQTKQELFINKCIKTVNDITQKLIISQTVNTLGFINSGLFTGFLITSNIVAITSASLALPVAIPLVASLAMLVLLTNSLWRHYNKYKELNSVIFLIFTTILRYFNIFKIMLKITKIYNFRLNIMGFITILSKLFNQLLLLANSEVFDEIEKVISISDPENVIFKLFTNIKNTRENTHTIKNWFTRKCGLFSPDENLINLGKLLNILTQEYLIIFSEFLLVLKVKEYNYDIANKKSFDCKHKEWSNSIEYLELLSFSKIKQTFIQETSESYKENYAKEPTENYKENLLEVIKDLKNYDINTIIGNIKIKLSELDIEKTEFNDNFILLIRTIKEHLEENKQKKIIDEEELIDKIIKNIQEKLDKKLVEIIITILKK
jgi:hypothetical protein